MNSQKLAVLILAAVVGCGRSEPDADQLSDAAPKTSSSAHPESEPSPTEAQPRPATDANKPTSALIHAEEKVSATGVKESVLLNIMNTNQFEDDRYRHDFEFVQRTEETSLYKDVHSSLILMITGPTDDLKIIALMIPVDDFLDEQPDSQIAGEGAAAFGRCVQRMALAVDPDWVEELYDWMNEQIPIALLTKEGATLTRKALMAKFGTKSLSDDLMMLSFMVGVPEENEP